MEFVQVGQGFRAQAFGRVLSEFGQVRCAGLVLRRDRAAAVPVPVPVYTDLGDLGEALDRIRPDFVLCFTPASATPAVIETAVAHGVRILAETPPAGSVGELDRLRDVADSGLVQVAEQYPFMPLPAAWLEAVRRGLIGQVSQVQVSSTQTYHALALIRAFLGVGPSSSAVVRAQRFAGPLVDPLTRAGWTGDSVAHQAGTTLATVDFGDGRAGVYDFTDNQTRNLLRTRRLVVRGSHGEINGQQIVRLAGDGLITTSDLNRRQTGHDLDLNGYCTYQVTLGDQVLWTNQWPEARWNDDELAVAQTLARTLAWVRGEGPGPYPLAEALADARLGLAIEEAVRADRPVEVPA